MNNFCAVIVTYDRADNVRTYDTLKRLGYTGDIILLVDDEDPQLEEYRKQFGDEVYVFSKEKAAQHTDAGTNSGQRNSPLFARNVIFDAVRERGYDYFVMLDDDYSAFYYRFAGEGKYGFWMAEDLDGLFSSLVNYLKSAEAITCLAISQGGDHIGGGENTRNQMIGHVRKIMNTYICSVDRPFRFKGILNDDVNTYVNLGNKGHVFLSLQAAQITQSMTQQNEGGLTDLYIDVGTYVKSFFTVMYGPSCTNIRHLCDARGNSAGRLHHEIRWRYAVPKIIREKHRKT
jgi:hypothetical protein